MKSARTRIHQAIKGTTYKNCVSSPEVRKLGLARDPKVQSGKAGNRPKAQPDL